MKPLITISIPIYNVEKYVERSLLSALNQTYDHLEILIVDDKGTDGSMDVVLRVAAEHPRGNQVRIIDHGVNQGLSATRNSAIEHATGAYIYWLDSDDYITDNCIELLYNKAVETNADLTIGSFREIYVNGALRNVHQLPSATYEGNDAYGQFYKSGKFYVMTWNKLYKTEVLRNYNVRCINEMNEDEYFSFQLFPVVKKLATISDITYSYVRGDVNAITYDMLHGKIDSRRASHHAKRLQRMYDCFKALPTVAQQPAMMENLLSHKICLLREIAIAKNLNTKEKRQLLSTVPAFPNIEQYAGQVAFRCKYYLANPLRTARIERLITPIWPLIRPFWLLIKHFRRRGERGTRPN